MAAAKSQPLPMRLTREQKRAFLRKRVSVPLAIFGGTLTLYLVFLLAALALRPLPLAIAASLLAGLGIVLLFIVGHDACHQSFTASRLANHVIGRIAFLPSLHPYSLWDLGHNRTHHRFNNIRGKDYVWEPMSPADYDAASPPARFAYRLFRTPAGVFLYYLVEVWAKRMVFVRPGRLPDKRPSYWWDLLAVSLFLGIQVYGLITLGAYFGKSVLASLLLGLIVPFLVWNALMSWAIYLHHIHPDIRWYRSVEEWRGNHGQLSGTAQVRFPKWVRKGLLHIMEHGGHHAAPGVPLYNLMPLQQVAAEHCGATWNWSFGEFVRIARECKLFDYEAGAWRRFDHPEARLNGRNGISPPPVRRGHGG